MATCRDPEGWRIVSQVREFDITICFEEGVLLSGLLAVFFVFASYRSLALSFQLLRDRVRKSWIFLWIKLALLAASCCVSVANVLFIIFSGGPVAVVYSYVVEPLTLASSIFLTYFNHTRTRSSSSLLLIFWPLYLTGLAMWIRSITNNGVSPDVRVILTLKSVIGGLGLISFALECAGPEVAVVPSLGDKLHMESPLNTANLFSVWSFGWMTPLMKQGASQFITESDLPSLRARDESKNLGQDLQNALQKHTLWKALFVAYGGPYAFAAGLKMFQDGLAFLQPQLLRWLLAYISDYQSARFGNITEGPSSLQGFAIAALMFIASAAQTVSLNQYFQRCFETGMRVRAGLVTAVYGKALVLSNDERTRASGDIVNLMSVDATRLQDLCTYGLIALSGPFQITLAFISLYDLLGWSAFVGVAIMIISIPLNTYIARILKRMQEEQMKNRDKRTRLMSELLANIKSIKLYAWEYSFVRRVLETRNNHEMKVLRKLGIVTAVNMSLWTGIPLLVAFSSFAVAALVSTKPLTSDIIFPAISLFMLLQFPLAMFSQVTSNIIEAIVSVKRLSEFLNAEELQGDARKVVIAPTLAEGDEVLSIQDADFSWEKNAVKPTLEGINLTVRKGELVGLLGRVGAGKTSLLSGIIGDMTRREGKVILSGSVAYAPQNPWILSATVRENILFSHEYDETFYNLVIEACALGQDLSLLPQGDLTEVGEKGITLSGGQRARISLARAVYARADLVLLDDCLAAVDSHVARHVFDNVIGPQGLLATKARILVTNSIAFVKQFDQLVFVRRGIILENGSYETLVANADGELSKLVRGHGSGSSSSGTSTPFVASNSGSVTPAEGQLVPSDLPQETEAYVGAISEKLRRKTSFKKALIAQSGPIRQAEAAGLSKEHQEQGRVKIHVYRKYIEAASKTGFFLFLLTTVLQQLAAVLANLTLRDWGEHNREVGSNQGMLKYLIIYGLFSFSSTIFGGVSSVLMWVLCALRSAKRLHDEMLDSLMRAPLSFFELTPTGRILNLFSRDIYVVDQTLARVIQGMCRTLAVCLFIAIVIGSSFPPFLIALIPLGFFYARVMKYYLATSRELKRLDAVSRSPIFAWFSESLAGLSTIRAFNQQSIFISANQRRIDRNQMCYLPSISVNRWLAVRLEFVGALIILIVALLAVTALITSGVDAGLVGLVLSYALNTTSSLNWVVRSASEVEQNIVSVERILHQTEVQPEAPQELPENKPSGVWPSRGEVEFCNYSTRYRPELDLVLKDISLTIKPREKIGVCGRTGAGKSSLLLALFRIIEPAEGMILIDSVDITKIGLHDLRSNISIVPQSPDLFEGTLRENIDPVGEHSDADIWIALSQSHLKEYVDTLPAGLDAPVREGGSSLSAGQRQLLCFARALLRKSKILVLDEATSAVDLDTDQAIQEIIRGPAFADVTMFTIAHRLNTIIESDRVLVMDSGKVAEFDTPETLLKNKDSIFYSLAHEAGLVAQSGLVDRRMDSRAMNAHQRLEAVTDLTQLSSPSDDVIVTCLRERFMTDNIYTSIGTSYLAALNPHKYVASNSDSVLHKYAAEYRDTSEHKQPLPPHIFQLANNAYYHMRRTSQDQTVIFRGETGSGKSENRRLAIKTLLELSVNSPGKKGSKLASQVPAAEFVLESFGNARTLFNPNASRFGKYTELQFSERGRLCGVKTLDYYLERNRVAGAPSGERNFHIFYYLVAGASPEERHHLHLLDKAAYRYLGQRGSSGRINGGRDDDEVRFEQLKVALKTIGLSKRHVAQTCQLIAAILHLGNFEFIVDRGRNEDAAVVRNTDLLGIVAEFLGVSPSDLESALSYKTKLVKKELCTVFLDPDGASDNRDDLAKNLYSLLFAWLNEHINQRLCKDDFSTFIGLFDLPGPQNLTSRANSLDQFCVNFANERLQSWSQKRIFESHVAEYNTEGIARYVPHVPYFDNSECIRLLQNKPGGLVHIMDDQARRAGRKTDQTMVEAFQKRWGSHTSFKTGSGDRNGNLTFTVSHFNGPVTYSSENFLVRNLDALNPDFVSLLRGTDGQEGSGSMNPFVKGLFSAKAIATQAHPRNEDTIVAAQQAVKPMRAPSTRRKNTMKRMPTLRENDGAEEKEEEEAQSGAGGAPCVAGEFKSALDTLFETLDEAQPWFVFCINPNDSQLPNQLEGRSVKGQVRSVGLAEISKRALNMFEVGLTPDEFCERYATGLEAAGVSDSDPLSRVQQARTTLGLSEKDIIIGQHKVFLSHRAFHTFEDQLRSRDVEEQKRNRLREVEAEAGLGAHGTSDPYAPYTSLVEPGEVSPVPWGGYNDQDNASNQALPLVPNASPFQRADLYDDYDEAKSLRSDDFDGRSRFTSQRDHDDTMSNFGSESYAPSRNMFQNETKKGLLADKEVLPGEIQDGETTEVLKESSARRKWVALCWMLTFWVPSPFLSWFGRMKRLDVRQAWREKLAINILIWITCGGAIFVIAFLGLLICPTEHVYNTSELASHSYQLQPNNVLVAIRGEVFDLNTITADHTHVVGVIPSTTILKYGGTVADNLFPVQVSALCNGVSGSVSPWVVLTSANTTDTNAGYHDFRAFTNDSRPDWYFESMVRMRYTARKGFVGYTPKEIRNMANAQGRSVGIYNGLIYDVTNYINSPPATRTPYGTQAPANTDTNFMHSAVIDIFKFSAGQDVTKQLDNLAIDSDILSNQKTCLRNLFTIGQVDNRNSTQCQFSTYLLLSLSIIMITVIGFKFLASVNFGAARAPEDHDKFVICQVPCYTEGDASLRKTIDSLAQLKYDDKRKLLLIICDGMIVGSGNDRPTPRIVLDILGADPNLDPEPLSFVSLGEGAKQHNMGKVYSGLYECSGHVVPYLVLVKVGKPTERSRPGNRGKRDSQMMVMHFLNKVHFNSPMNPLELEMYHQIKNVIGVNPTFYEYLLTVDADTTVDPFSVNRLISAMIHDKKLLGVCGETELANAKQSIVTMMQVYEYFISHHMAKAFESLFGSVTCLPGCFTLYRLRTPDTHKPLLISNQIIEDYSENRVNTLHMKNLLHLGEDRYLTTLLLKHFPLNKTQFVRDAHAYTVAPDDWKVLLSQRRRWINSTVHNLGELIFLEQLCGFCCFSMRFIVMIDLISTLTQPVTVLYIAYLIYQVVGEHKPVPELALILIAAIYGLQAAVFILRRKWDMIGWMVFYILAIPAFSFFLPLYSFWRMDDFSWGQTRVVLGESGKKMIVHDEGKFDPRAIPLKSWTDYENELWDKESNHSIGSWVPPTKMKGEGYAESRTSIYGRETYYEPRSHSPSPSQLGMHAPPGYNSGRNTPLSNFRMADGGSILHQPAPSRPVTNYLDIPIPTTGSPDNLNAPGSPTDFDIERAVHNILRGADLNTVTKREIRRRLEETFGMDLTSRKASINASIDRALLGQA